MPHEKKKEKDKNRVKTVKDYIFKTIIIFQTTFGGTYMLCKIKYIILVNIWSRLLGQRSNIGGLVEVQSGVKIVMKENHAM